MLSLPCCRLCSLHCRVLRSPAAPAAAASCAAHICAVLAAACSHSCQQPLLCLLQLANVLSTEALFYTCIIPFIAFFGSFAFILYPLRDVLHPHGEPDCCWQMPAGVGPAGWGMRQAAVRRAGLLAAASCGFPLLVSQAWSSFYRSNMCGAVHHQQWLACLAGLVSHL